MDLLEENLTRASGSSLINTGSFYSHEIIKVKSGVPLEDRGFVQSIPHLANICWVTRVTPQAPHWLLASPPPWSQRHRFKRQPNPDALPEAPHSLLLDHSVPQGLCTICSPCLEPLPTHCSSFNSEAAFGPQQNQSSPFSTLHPPPFPMATSWSSVHLQ